ncbi:uncharacterized protein LOC111692382 [Anoplophora glabripennis]|uniref:uncharacterized protein LOC111692382 n=1 Tax=Anoplophora glabripennis TaxID=217634 RepID=UPI000C783E05|nr:uncharacterized protein LOC111692382 [Anoplophora glabripennis]
MNVLKIGIIQKKDNELHFVHRTFAEYFVAESLIEELRLGNQNVDFQRFLIEEILIEYHFSVTRAFLNGFLYQVVDDLSSKTFQKYQHFSYKSTSFDTLSSDLLHRLVEKGHVAIVQLILKCVDFNITAGMRDQHLEAPFTESNPDNILNTIRTRLRQEGLEIKDALKGATLLESAIMFDRLEMAKFLLKQGANVKNVDFTHLLLSAECGQFDRSKFLIEQGADIRAKYPIHRTTVLYKIIQRNNPDMAAYVLDTILTSDGLYLSYPIIPYTAAYLGRLDMLKRLMEQGLDANSQVENGETMIFGAARGGKLETIRYLARQGCDLNSKDCWNDTALHIISGDSSLFSTAKLLVKLGICFNAENLNSATAFHFAVEASNFDLVKLLVNRGTDVNLKDGKGSTALHVAASNIQGNIVRFLVKHHANINSKDKNGRTVLHLVISKGAALDNTWSVKRSQNYILADQLHIIKFFIDTKGDINIEDASGYTALHLAAASGQLEIVQLLIESKANGDIRDRNGRTALHLAVFRGHLDIVEFLARHEVNVNIKDKYGHTLIHYLVLSTDHLDVLKLILEGGGDANLQSKNGRTALHLATDSNNLDAVKLLVEFGVDFNIKCSGGNTALHTAVKKGYFSIAEYLIRVGADTTVRNHFGCTALHFAANRGDWAIISMLGGRDYMTRQMDTYRDRSDFIKILECGVDVGTTDNNELFLMNIRSRERKLYLDIVKILVAGCSELVNVKDLTGSTALHLAVLKGDLEVVEFLVSHNADVSIKNYCGLTAAQLAVENERPDMVKLLVKAGADVST